MCKKGAIKLMIFTTCTELHIGSSLLDLCLGQTVLDISEESDWP